MTDRGTLPLPVRLMVVGGIAGIIAGIFVPYGNAFGNSFKLLSVSSTSGFRGTIPLAIEPFGVAIALGVLALVPNAGRRAGAAIAALGGVTALYFLGRVLFLFVPEGGSVHYLKAGAFIGLAGGVVALVAGAIGAMARTGAESAPQRVRQVVQPQQVQQQQVQQQAQPVQQAAVAPAGWYPDPTGQGRERYWDGQHWSETTR